MALTSQDRGSTTQSTGSAGTTGVIPVLNLAPLNEPVPDPAAQAALAAELRDTLTEMGFFFIVNHGIPATTIELMFDEARRLHALPQPVKDSIPMGKVVGGYLGMGGGTSYASDIAGPVRKPNQNEAFFCHRHGYHTHNQYPPLEHFAERCESYIDQLIALGSRMLPILALSLDLPPDYFDPHFDEPSVSLRMSHYPPMDYDDNEWGLAPHSDSSVFTFLPANDVPGLEIRPAGYDWISPPQMRGSYLVNSGDMLKRWTNNAYLSTAHRARNLSAGDRYAVPFFYGARDDAVVDPVPTAVSSERPARHEPITYGDYQRWFLNRNYANVTGEKVGKFET
ncbi:isopenicillin N synthase family dioxygenase [Candidatus Poriferisodalis sp.]|uniref:isopenicillin N synthase family dioxygenase n=1 Tax=Candidatus Poriferisodalis sp. TaxID=3101277 RepID=UPI003B5A695E